MMSKAMKISKVCLLILLSGTINSCRGECEEPSKQIDLIETNTTFIDMGTDYNDELVPRKFKRILANITLHENSVSGKYTDRHANLRLPKAISALHSKLINHKLDPASEILTTVGGTEALFSTIKGLSSVGDEWIIIEPFYSKFEQQIKFSNAVPRFTTMRDAMNNHIDSKKCIDENAADWILNRSEMESLINHKTRGIMFNNPNNPLGKSYNRSDLDFITELVKKHNLLIISDEVHEFTTHSMIRMASIPGMFNRTITIGSASKTFGVPGWRIGWAYGPSHLMEKIKKVHSQVVGSASLPQQAAVSHIFNLEAVNFGLPETLIQDKFVDIQRKRKFIVQALRNAGMAPIVPQGGYCMLTCWPPLKANTNLAEWLRNQTDIHGLSASEYYSENHRQLGLELIRLCYNKSNKTLENAAESLMKLKKLEIEIIENRITSYTPKIEKLLLEIFYSNGTDIREEKLLN